MTVHSSVKALIDTVSAIRCKVAGTGKHLKDQWCNQACFVSFDWTDLKLLTLTASSSGLCN